MMIYLRSLDIIFNIFCCRFWSTGWPIFREELESCTGCQNINSKPSSIITWKVTNIYIWLAMLWSQYSSTSPLSWFSSLPAQTLCNCFFKEKKISILSIKKIGMLANQLIFSLFLVLYSLLQTKLCYAQHNKTY